MCMCVRVGMYKIHMNVCIYSCMFDYFACVCIMYVCVCMHVCMYVCIYVCTHVFVFMHA